MATDELPDPSLVYLPHEAFVHEGQVTNLCEELMCWRPEGHGGRHAVIRDIDGAVLRVWGEDVHAAARAHGRGNGHCSICAQDLSPAGLEDVIDHLRLMHPDVYGDGPPRWPDGGLVVIDETLDPDSFADGAS